MFAEIHADFQLISSLETCGHPISRDSPRFRAFFSSKLKKSKFLYFLTSYSYWYWRISRSKQKLVKTAIQRSKYISFLSKFPRAASHLSAANSYSSHIVYDTYFCTSTSFIIKSMTLYICVRKSSALELSGNWFVFRIRIEIICTY